MNRFLYPVLALLMLSLTGCDIIEGIFKAGFWTAIILIGLVLLAVWGIARMVRGGRGTP
jgi:hypothetical protein